MKILKLSLTVLCKHIGNNKFLTVTRIVCSCSLIFIW